MTYRGHEREGADPFGPDPFGAPPRAAGQAPPVAHATTSPGFGPPPVRAHGEANTSATLSIVFAFVFAPAGAVLGHLALSQIRKRGQPGRERALVGLTLSYVVMVLAVIALVIWLLVGNGVGSAPSGPAPTTGGPPPPRAAVPPPQTTVVTPPPAQRPTVSVDELRVGECVEVQQTRPDPTRGPGTDQIRIFPVRCEVRDGVFQVDQILSNHSCPGQTLFNPAETRFACISDFRGST
jgi:Domain of unknown function (DUF4190)